MQLRRQTHSLTHVESQVLRLHDRHLTARVHPRLRHIHLRHEEATTEDAIALASQSNQENLVGVLGAREFVGVLASMALEEILEKELDCAVDVKEIAGEEGCDVSGVVFGDLIDEEALEEAFGAVELVGVDVEAVGEARCCFCYGQTYLLVGDVFWAVVWKTEVVVVVYACLADTTACEFVLMLGGRVIAACEACRSSWLGSSGIYSEPLSGTFCADAVAARQYHSGFSCLLSPHGFFTSLVINFTYAACGFVQGGKEGGSDECCSEQL